MEWLLNLILRSRCGSPRRFRPKGSSLHIAHVCPTLSSCKKDGSGLEATLSWTPLHREELYFHLGRRQRQRGEIITQVLHINDHLNGVIWSLGLWLRSCVWYSWQQIQPKTNKKKLGLDLFAVCVNTFWMVWVKKKDSLGQGNFYICAVLED